MLAFLAGTREVEIETLRTTGDARRTVIWVVVVNGDAYVRSVRGERGAWFRELRQQGVGMLRLAGHAIAVRAEPATDDASVQQVSAALVAKYRRGSAASTASMLRDETLGTTLRLIPTA